MMNPGDVGPSVSAAMEILGFRPERAVALRGWRWGNYAGCAFRRPKAFDSVFIPASPAAIPRKADSRPAGDPCSRARPLTYGRLYQHIETTGVALRAMGIGRRDRVAVVLPNGPEMTVAILAVAANAACAPMNPAYGAEELDRYFADLRPCALITRAGADSPARRVALSCGVCVVDISSPPDAEAGLFTLMGDRRTCRVSRGGQLRRRGAAATDVGHHRAAEDRPADARQCLRVGLQFRSRRWRCEKPIDA